MNIIHLIEMKSMKRKDQIEIRIRIGFIDLINMKNLKKKEKEAEVVVEIEKRKKVKKKELLDPDQIHIIIKNKFLK